MKQVELEITLGPEFQTQSLIFILYTSFSMSLLILLLPHQTVNANLVPTLLVAARASLFCALVIAVMLSFTGATVALLIQNKTQQQATVRRFCLRVSVVSMASTLSILGYDLVLEIFRLLGASGDGADSFSVYRYVFGKICPDFHSITGNCSKLRIGSLIHADSVVEEQDTYAFAAHQLQ